MSESTNDTDPIIEMLKAFKADPDGAVEAWQARNAPDDLRAKLDEIGLGDHADALIEHLQNDEVWDALARAADALGIRPESELEAYIN